MAVLLGPKVLVLSIAACFIELYQVAARVSERDSQTLSPVDASFCHGGLEVIYPELDINKCIIISRDQRLREKVSREWTAPQMCLASADKGKMYVLMMVDPDAPSRSKPSRSHWRHWLVVDIKGSSLRRADIKGTTLTEYSRPTPPQNSGLHRYQFMLFEQPTDKTLTLTKEEKSSLGNWDPQAFIGRFGLGSPVATVQFLTQNHNN